MADLKADPRLDSLRSDLRLPGAAAQSWVPSIKEMLTARASVRYSCRKASIGSKREAGNAGTMPLHSPTTPKMGVDGDKFRGGISSRISPPPPFWAKAL